MNVALHHSQDLPSAEALELHISRATEALLAAQRKDGHWCFELEADATIPAEYVLLRHFRGEAPDLELERLIGVYLRRVQGDHGGWPLVHAGPFDISASVKAYFALKMIGDDIDALHMRSRPRGDPGAWRRGSRQCLHALPARALRRDSVERRADDAGRDHAAAALVPLPSREDFLLGADGARSPSRAAGAEAETRQSASREGPGAVRRAAGDRSRLADGGASSLARREDFRGHRLALEAGRASLSDRAAPAGDRQGRGLRHRAAQWRRRPRRHLSGHGERGPDV